MRKYAQDGISFCVDIERLSTGVVRVYVEIEDVDNKAFEPMMPDA